MRFLRNTRVGVRLGVAFGLLIVLLLVLVGVGFTNAASSQRVDEQLITDIDTTRDIDEVKFHASEFNGSQTSYVFDAALGKPQGSDERHGTRTYVTEFGLDGARGLALASHRSAREALALAAPGGGGELADITDFIATRES